MRPRSILRFASAHALALALAASAAAVIIDSGDGTGNTSAPSAPDCALTDCSDPGWSHVGIRSNGLTGVYLGGRFVLTASHVGPGDISLGGVTYTYVPGTAVQFDNGDGTYADLVMFQIYPEPPLPALAIASLPPVTGTALILAGHGVNRGDAYFDPPLPRGYYWGPGQSLRWGTNAIAGVLSVEIEGVYTTAISTTFDKAGSDHEAQGAVGDSGGAAFARSLTQWELVGIVFAIGSVYPTQPSGTALYGNLTFSADLSTYREQIDDVMAMPEPTGGLWPGAAVVVLLARRRRARPTCA